MKKVKLGIIGIGNMGTGHISMIQRGLTPELELVAIADVKEERQEWAKANLDESVRIYADGSELIKNDDCEAVLIAVPHYDHPRYAIEALEHGKHVMVEKPAGVYTKAVRELNEFAKKQDKVFAMMFNQRTNPLYRRMYDLVHSGELGEIKRVNWLITDWYRPQSYYDSGAWRATWAGEGGGVLLNQCPHNLDLMQWICGMPVRVRAFTHIGKWHDIEVEDDVTAYLEFENGATGTFITSTGDAPGTNRFEIQLDGGRLVAENGKLTLDKLEVGEREWSSREHQNVFATPPMEQVVVDTSGENPQHVGVLNAFAAHILHNDPLIAEGYEGINGLMLSNAMHLSDWLGDIVSLPIDEDLFLEKLNELRATSRLKDVEDKVADVDGTYGSNR